MAPSPQLTSAVVIATESLLLGLYMSFRYRIKIVLADKSNALEMLNSATFKNSHRMQLNCAEWNPIFIALLLFLHSQGSGTAWVAGLSALGCIGFAIEKELTKMAPLTATARYIALAFLINDVYQVANLK
eukprot:m.130564 g.130564  ORF g.130564 m.130564 type:complete len:130 (+) comp17472_c0_seq5:127-516(+)